MRRFQQKRFLPKRTLFLWLLWLAVAGLGLQSCNSNKDSIPVYKSPNDLQHADIGIVSGTTYAELIHERLPEATVRVFEEDFDSYAALYSRKVDALVIDDVSQTWAKNNDARLTVLVKNWEEEELGMAFSKENPVLRKEFNQFLVEMRAAGVLNLIAKKWVYHSDTAQMPDLSHVSRSGKPIVVAVAPMPAFVFKKGDGMAGIDIEIVERFAAYLHRPIQINVLKSGGLMAAITSSRADMAAAGIAITKEREKEVDFSDCYNVGCCDIVILSENSANPPQQVKSEISFLKKIGNSFHNNLIVDKRYMLIVNGLAVTLIIAFFSILFGTILGAGICYMRMSQNKHASNFARFYIGLLQGIPILVLLMILFYLIFARSSLSATVVSVITFSLNFSAIVAEILRHSIESIDVGQREAGLSMGFSPFKTFRYIIFPQALKRLFPLYKGSCVSLVKTTSVVGYVAVQDLAKASDIIQGCTFDAFFPLIIITIIYFILTWLIGKGLDLLIK